MSSASWSAAWASFIRWVALYRRARLCSVQRNIQPVGGGIGFFASRRGTIESRYQHQFRRRVKSFSLSNRSPILVAVLPLVWTVSVRLFQVGGARLQDETEVHKPTPG